MNEEPNKRNFNLRNVFGLAEVCTLVSAVPFSNRFGRPVDYWDFSTIKPRYNLCLYEQI